MKFSTCPTHSTQLMTEIVRIRNSFLLILQCRNVTMCPKFVLVSLLWQPLYDLKLPISTQFHKGIGLHAAIMLHCLISLFSKFHMIEDRIFDLPTQIHPNRFGEHTHTIPSSYLSFLVCSVKAGILIEVFHMCDLQTCQCKQYLPKTSTPYPM